MAIYDQMPPEMAQDIPVEGLYELEPEAAVIEITGPAVSDKMQKLIDSDNIAAEMKDERLRMIASRCNEGYLVDEKSREDYLKVIKKAIKLAMQYKGEGKTFPWRGSANVKLPLIADASIKFAARAYSEIIKDNKVVKGKVVGEDPSGVKESRAERVGDYMSWQLTEKEVEWEADTDKLMHVLPVVGHMFRKRYYCSERKRTVSELCMPDDVCINNQASSLESARRITHIIKNVQHNEVVSSQRAGIWRDVELRKDSETSEEKDSTELNDYYVFLEQHCWLDLDGDGYEEPYIVTYEKDTLEIVRIVANYNEHCVTLNDSGEVMSVTPKCSFADYSFMPSLDGGYYGMGFGQLMTPLTESANTIVNQLLDGGTLNNIQGGFLSKEVKLLKGRYRFEAGEWKTTAASAEQLRNGVFPLPTKEPSPTLFNMLGLILDLTKDLSSVKDVLAGDTPGNVSQVTVMALIEQGMKTFNAIYKRIYRSLKKEYKQLFYLNGEYLDEIEYFTVLDNPSEISRNDFNAEDIDIIPIADPNLSTDIQRLARAEALRGAIGMPGVDPKPIIRVWLEALNTPSDLIDEILPEQDPGGTPPHVMKMMQDVELKQADVTNKERELELKERELAIKEREMEVKIFETLTKGVKNLADAEAAEQGTQLDSLLKVTDALFKQSQSTEGKDVNERQSDSERLQAMVGAPGNTEVPSTYPEGTF